MGASRPIQTCHLPLLFAALTGRSVRAAGSDEGDLAQIGHDGS